MTKRFRIPIRWIVTVLILAGVAAYVATHLQIQTIDRGNGKANNLASPGAIKVAKGLAELPNDANFKTIAENDKLRLKLDSTTAHFIVEDKKDGRVWRSYPDPDQWNNESTSNSLYRSHERSPIMLQYIDLSGNKSQPKETNLLEEQGTLKDLKITKDGFSVTFDMPSKQIAIPIEVKLDGDSVTTRIVDSGVKEGQLSLLWVRLYPFFGAERSEGQDGYMFVPDGSGALIQFDPNSTNVNRYYREPIFGEDYAFRTAKFGDPRRPVTMPVFGLKNDDKGFMAIAEDGAEYGEILASPAGVYGTYNWATVQQDYRQQFRQITNRAKKSSFITYDKDDRFHGDRVVRYIFLDKDQSSYVGMAQRYRQYLMNVFKLQPFKPKSNKVPMDAVIFGADTAKGLVWDRYIKATTTNEAMQIVQRLYGLGIDNMNLRYYGWQENGYGSYGGHDTVDSRLGGDSGMEQLIKFTHSLDIPVYLQTDYTRNNNGAAGFSSRLNGLRDLGGTPLDNLVSHKFVLDKVLNDDVNYFKKLGVDGIEMDGIGRWLNSDFNTKWGADRIEAKGLQQKMMDQVKKGVGSVIGDSPNFYALPYVSEIANLQDDYSYDLFSKTGVPFAQIAIHGLIPYTGYMENERDQFHVNFLHDLEYGSNPSYLFTYTASDNLKYAQDYYFYSPSYKDWEQQAVQDFQKYSDALGDVQDQFIVNHQILTPEVHATTYANGKTVVVNYGVAPYQYGNQTVKPSDYLVVKGGAKP